jgi:6-phosphofructokinase
MKRLGILTGGGDVPGLNPCIKTVVYEAIDAGYEVLGIRRGWAGLLKYNPEVKEHFNEFIVPLHKINTRTIDRSGGTVLHTSRTNPAKVAKKDIPEFLRDKDYAALDDKSKSDFTPHILKVLKQLEMDALIAIGGDDTLSYAVRLHKENFPVIAIPKTMDNDVFGTDYCIGFSTSITRSVEFLNNLRTPTGSHERIAVVELFGRNSGETSLIAAYVANVDRAIISEVPFDPEKLAHFLMKDKKNNPSKYAIMTISEGAVMTGGKTVEYGQEDAFGHRKLGGIGELTSDAIKKITGCDMIYQSLGYLMRSGEPDILDRMVTMNYANIAVNLLKEKKFGMMAALQEGKYTTIPIETAIQGKRTVDVKELYDAENYRPKISNMVKKPMFLY